jgi:3-hydroxyisobutyrate dehydrogenase
MQPQGLLKASGGLQPSLLIDSSTILPTYTSELAQRIHTYTLLAPGARKVAGAPGPVFVDAPVSGGVIGAVAGTLTFMVRRVAMCSSSSSSSSTRQPRG